MSPVRADELRLEQTVVAIDGMPLEPHGDRWPWVTSLNTSKPDGGVFVALSWSPWSASLKPDTPVTVLDEGR